MSFREGAQIDHVVSLRAVTGEGRIVDCSEHRHRELFEMLLAGQGQVGVIVEATLRLVPAPSTVRLYDLIYPDLATLLADITSLIEDERFDQMESFVIPTGPGQWLYLLEAISFHTDAGPPDDVALLTGLGHVPEQTIITDLDFLDWSSHVADEPPARPNPWCDLLLPMSAAATFIEEVQATIAPVVPGDAFNLLLIPFRSSRFTRSLFRTPDEELGIGFDPLRSLPPGTDVEPVLAYNRRLYDRCKELGGSQYPISAIRLDVDDWKLHYGEQWDRLRDAKRRFDRDDTLASGPDVLGRRRQCFVLRRRRAWRSMARATRRSISSGYVTPAACHSFGYIEIGVKPGIVLASLQRNPRPSSSRKKSTRARPSQRRSWNTRTARARTSSVCAGRQRRRDEELGPVGDVLVVVVVELGAGDDLAGTRCLGVRAAEHGDLDLPADDGLLDDDPLVVRQGVLDPVARAPRRRGPS